MKKPSPSRHDCGSYDHSHTAEGRGCLLGICWLSGAPGSPPWQPPLHRRLAWRLPIVVAGILLASGRRTITGWCRGAEVTTGVRSYYYFLDVVGRKTKPIAAQLLQIIAREIPTQDRRLFAIDDTPTKRYGPKVQGAGVHHNPTPGPAGSNFLYGHCWVTLSQVLKHDHFGTIGLPLLGQLYVRKKDVPGLPAEAKIAFRTKLQMAAEMLTTLGSELPQSAQRPWAVVDGAYAKREFLRPAMQAGFTVVARLRKDAALFDLPPVMPPGTKRGRGRPPIYGKNSLSLAKRAGPEAGLGRGHHPHHDGTPRGRTLQDLPGDVGPGRRGDPGGDPQGPGRLVASVFVQRSAGQCRGDRSSRARPLGDRAELS